MDSLPDNLKSLSGDGYHEGKVIYRGSSSLISPASLPINAEEAFRNITSLLDRPNDHCGFTQVQSFRSQILSLIDHNLLFIIRYQRLNEKKFWHRLNYEVTYGILQNGSTPALLIYGKDGFRDGRLQPHCDFMSDLRTEVSSWVILLKKLINASELDNSPQLDHNNKNERNNDT